jgi:hypothetical protein
LLPLALLITACAVGAAQPELQKQITQQDGWVAYRVPIAADAGTPCCYEIHGKNVARTGCDLEGRSWGISGDAHSPAQPASDALDVYLRVAHGRVDSVRALGASCPVRDAERVRRLDAVEPRASIAMLTDLAAAAPTSSENADGEIAAIALHAETSATSALEKLSGTSHPRELREKALFWLGQARGADGARIVERAATSDADPELRANAVFDLSESHAVDAYASIHHIAQTDSSEHVREQALFWMAQMDDPRAEDDITKAIASETSEHMLEQAVFALSQLKGERADAALIALVRGQYPRKVKEQALFWLGQSGSTRALEFIDSVLSKPPRNLARGSETDSQ